MRALQGGEVQVMRVLTELCAPDLEAYHPGGAEDDESYVGVMLVGAGCDGILDIQASGTGDDPVVTIRLLPVGDATISAEVEDRWGPGEHGRRPRRVSWAFRWETGDERKIVYDLALNGEEYRYGMAARRRSALMLARLAGWPLP
jgi:hypothetical protein